MISSKLKGTLAALGSFLLITCLAYAALAFLAIQAFLSFKQSGESNIAGTIGRLLALIAPMLALLAGGLPAWAAWRHYIPKPSLSKSSEPYNG